MKGLLLFFQLVGLVFSRTTSRKEDKPIPPEQDSQESEVTVEGEEESLIPPQDVGSGGGLTTEEWKIVSLLQKIQTKYPKLPEEDRYEFLEKLSSYRDRFARTIGKVETLPENFDLNLPLLKGALELELEQQMPRASIDPFFLGSQPGAVDNIPPLYDMVVKGKLPQAYQNPLSPEENEAMYLSRKIEEYPETEEEMADSSLDNLDLSSLKKMGVNSATLTQMTKMKPLQRNRLVKKLLMSNVLKNLLSPPQAAYPVPSWYNPYAQQQHQSVYPKLFSHPQYYQQGFSLPMQDERDSWSFPESSWETPVADPDEDGLDLDFLRELDNVPTGTKEDREMQAAYKLLGETLGSIPFDDFHSVDVQLNLPYPQQTSLYPNLYHHPPSRRSRRHAGSFGGGLTDLELLAVTGGFKNNDNLLPLLALSEGTGPGWRRYRPRPVHRPPVILAPPPMLAPPPPPMLAPPPPPMIVPPPPPKFAQPPPMTLPPHYGYPSYLRNPGNYWGQADIINPHYSYSKMMYNNHLFNSVEDVDVTDNYAQT